MRLDCVFYYVMDLDRAVDFYAHRLGFVLESRDVVARFRVDGLLFELVPAADPALCSGTGNARLTFETEDIGAEIERLRAKGVAVGAIERVSNGQLARFNDPDGNELVLWQYARTTDSVLPNDLLGRFLRVLGLSRRAPSPAFLRDLVAAYVTRVPFENVSKIYRWKRLGLTSVPDAATFLEGIERFRFGGTCYANNYHLWRLLAALGFEVRLCGADMREPDVHMVVLAELEGREYLLDAGYAAPFLEPMPCDLPVDHVIALGRDRYVLRPRDAAGCSRMELWRDGELKHGYLVKPAARQLEAFRGVVAESFRPAATFLNALLLTRFQPGAALVVHNLTVTESRGLASATRTLRDRDELVATIRTHFGMPAEVVRDVLAELGSLGGDAWR